MLLATKLVRPDSTSLMDDWALILSHNDPIHYTVTKLYLFLLCIKVITNIFVIAWFKQLLELEERAISPRKWNS